MQVQVPATSANLGPGFDSLGLALGMHDRYIAQILDEAIMISTLRVKAPTH